MHQHNNYLLWAVSGGILLPVFLGALSGHALGALIFAVCVRLTVVYHATFCINSVCHTFGKSTYDVDSTAKDNWFAALLTNGEGYHNYHHHFPTDYRNGVRWYQWDSSKWAIALLEKMGLATDLRRTSSFQIIRARLVAQNTLALRSLQKKKLPMRIARMLDWNYRLLEKKLQDWEMASYEFKLKAHTAFCSRRRRWNLLTQRFIG